MDTVGMSSSSSKNHGPKDQFLRRNESATGWQAKIAAFSPGSGSFER
jgi:hypothetical protein